MLFLYVILRSRYGLAGAQLTRLRVAGLPLTVCVEQVCVLEPDFVSGLFLALSSWISQSSQQYASIHQFSIILAAKNSIQSELFPSRLGDDYKYAAV
jgi:hypothetical protein